MKTIEIKGSLRSDLGKKATKQLRKEENVPCVLYGGKENVHFYASAKDFRHLIYTPNVYLVKLNLGGTEYNAIMQEIQFHPVSDKPLHIDFIEYNEDEPIKIDVPVKLEGFAKGVQKGGKLFLAMRRVKVEGLSKNIPDNLTIDVTPIELGKSLKVGDLSYDNLELLSPASGVVVAVKLTRAARGAAAAAGETEEGEEASE